MFLRVSNGFYAGSAFVQIQMWQHGRDKSNVVSKLFSDVKQEKIAEPPFSSLKGMKGGRF